MNKQELQTILNKLYQRCEECISLEEVPVSCALVLENGDIIYTSNQVEKKNDPFAHAEQIAIKEGIKRSGTRYLKGATLIVSLEPCLMCMGAILKSGISTLYYLCDDEKAGALSYYHTFVDDSLKVVRLEDKRFDSLLSSFFTKIRLKKENK